MLQRPEADEYQPFHAGYIALVPENDIVGVLLAQTDAIESLMGNITPEQEHFRYAPGKWSVREVFGHLADAERIFGYRALCLARGQTTPLPPFDENLFVETAHFDARPVAELGDELLLLRHANLSMLQPLEDAAWKHRGTVSEAPSTARAIAWIMAGHVRHHLEILRDRYQLPLGMDRAAKAEG